MAHLHHSLFSLTRPEFISFFPSVIIKFGNPAQESNILKDSGIGSGSGSGSGGGGGGGGSGGSGSGSSRISSLYEKKQRQDKTVLACAAGETKL